MREAFKRTEALLGSAGLEKIQDSAIAVIGLGGVGSYAAEAIARCGVGTITLVDHDRLEPSNINRQLPALVSTMGLYKADVVAARLADINPRLEIRKYTRSFNPQSSEEILAERPDYVIDAIDSLPDKVHLIKTCLNKNIPIISSMGTALRLNPSLLRVADIKDTSGCPLARRLRRELHKENIYTGFQAVYSIEPPRQPVAGKAGELGSIVTVTASAGLLLASVVINQLLE